MGANYVPRLSGTPKCRIFSTSCSVHHHIYFRYPYLARVNAWLCSRDRGYFGKYGSDQIRSDQAQYASCAAFSVSHSSVSDSAFPLSRFCRVFLSTWAIQEYTISSPISNTLLARHLPQKQKVVLQRHTYHRHVRIVENDLARYVAFRAFWASVSRHCVLFLSIFQFIAAHTNVV